MSTTADTATAILPFHLEISDDELTDLRRRITATRWPSTELVADRSQGVQLARCRSSRASGRPITTGARSRRGSTRFRSSRPRSTGSTSTSST